MHIQCIKTLNKLSYDRQFKCLNNVKILLAIDKKPNNLTGEIDRSPADYPILISASPAFLHQRMVRFVSSCSMVIIRGRENKRSEVQKCTNYLLLIKLLTHKPAPHGVVEVNERLRKLQIFFMMRNSDLCFTFSKLWIEINYFSILNKLFIPIISLTHLFKPHARITTNTYPG